MIVLIVLVIVLVVVLHLPSAETRGKMRLVQEIDEYIMNKDQLKNEIDRKHAEQAERRNRAATYDHRNTAQIRPRDYESEEWGCVCGGLGCVNCQHFDL